MRCNIKKLKILIYKLSLILRKFTIMVLTIKQGATKKRIKTLLENIAKELQPKGVDVYNYVGKINLKKDALAIQRSLRNEWE